MHIVSHGPQPADSQFLERLAVTYPLLLLPKQPKFDSAAHENSWAMVAHRQCLSQEEITGCQVREPGWPPEQGTVIGSMAFDPTLRKHTIQNFANLPIKMRQSPLLLEDVVIRIFIQLRKPPVFQHGSILFGTTCIIIKTRYFVWRNYYTSFKVVLMSTKRISFSLYMK
jgi:hypothetical protein